MKIGTILRDVRRKKGIKQKDLSSLCGISNTYLCQIEKNLKEPNTKTLKNISHQLDIPLPILLFLSIEINDISDKKQEAFRIISEPVKVMLNEVFISKGND